MSLLAQVAAALAQANVSYALIGASALSVHGVNRATLDLDLLALDSICLQRDLWTDLEAHGIEVDVRRGDLTDPLAGVVRFRAAGERPVDLVVGKFTWQRRILERARPARFAGVPVPVPGPADLILLKLYAGGPQDAWDIQQILAGEDRKSLIEQVEQSLSDLPARSADFWNRILEG